MEIFIWLSQAVVPLVGWWILIVNFQKLAEKLQANWTWNENFYQDFLKSFLLSFCHGTPENHCASLKKMRTSPRVELLQLGLRSLSYGFGFLILFGVWNFIPSSVLLLLGLAVFLISQWFSQWWKPAQSLAFFFLGLGIFIFGFENLLNTSSQIVRASEQSPWIYSLAHNYLAGALIGVVLGSVLRLVTRMSGVAWWAGMNLLLSGILSLGGAWGFILGDFLMGLAEDFYKHKEKDYRLRCGFGISFGLGVLILSAPFQWLVTSWINGQYSVQLRSLQLAFMVFVFLALESSVALGFLHFYFHRKKVN